jgi:hypothetical protein
MQNYQYPANQYYSGDDRGADRSMDDINLRVEREEAASPRKFIGSTFAMTVLGLLVPALIIVVLFTNNSASKIMFRVQTKTLESSSDNYDIDIQAYNPSYDDQISLDYFQWDALVEPFKDNVMEITSFKINDVDYTSNVGDKSLYTVEWSIDNGNFNFLNSPATVNVEKTGVVNATVTITDVASSVYFTKSFTVGLKYVRREIRTMNDDDRDTFLSALRTLYDVDQTTGEAKYGKKYLSSETILQYHLNGAARSDCDHWHDGAGFVTHHVALTLAVEQAVQAIDPSIAMPYWEYGQDSYLYDLWYQSDVFRDDWFGAADSVTDDHSIARGLWAGLQMPEGDPELVNSWDMATEKSLQPYINARGMLRSPWNNNPSKAVGRHNTTYGVSTTVEPNCEIMQAGYHSSSYASMSDSLNGVSHGPIHILIGGAWGDDTDTWSRETSFLQGMNRVLYFKNLWRTGFTRCPTECSDDEDCACSIPDEYLELYTPTQILEASGLYDILGDQISGYSDEQLTAVLRGMEDPDVIGEMYSSGASFDPSFWPLHGQIERILSRKRIMSSLGVVNFHDTWGWETNNYRYLVGVCDWSGVKDVTDLTLPSCNMSKDAWCDGHQADYTLEFGNFLGNGDSYTNVEFYDFIHPLNAELPYIYDTYEFDYCTELGYDFDSVDSLEKTQSNEEKKSRTETQRH